MPKDEGNAALLDVVEKSTQATQAATDAVKDALLALPNMLAAALAQNNGAAAQEGAAQPQANAAAIAPTLAQTTARELRDRRVPDFWEHDPRAWFVILDAHFAAATTAPTQQAKFGLMLPLLTTAAAKKLSRFIAAPPADVYTKCKEALLRHFERAKEEMIEELFNLSSLGDMTAVDFLEYMRSLQPGEAETGLFKHIFVKALPKHVTGIVSHHQTLDEMAAAADVVLRAVPDTGTPLTSPIRDDPHVDAVRRDQLVGGLCFIHSRYGREAYSCALPDQCRMKNQTRPRRSPAGQQRPRSGNASAGRQ